MADILHAHTTADIAAFIVELTERIPARDRTEECFKVAIARKFPDVEDDQLHEAQEIAATQLKRWRR